MMKDRQNLDCLWLDTIEQTTGKVQQDSAPESRRHLWVQFRVLSNACDCAINGCREFSTQSATLRLVPITRL